jgi:5-methyltetrahydropteroyltriglutamate--homocysteine methyltransferase
MNKRDDATRAETVGSLLRPADVLEAVQEGSERAAETLDRAVLDAIRIQRDAGLDIITDGEMRRIVFSQTPFFLDCFERRPGGSVLDWRGGTDPESAPASYSERADFTVSAGEPTHPVVVRRVTDDRRTGNMAAEYAFLAGHAQGTRTKYALASPSFHRRYWSDEHSTAAYDSCEEFLTAIRDYEREVVEEVVALGCDYIQLDAPNYGSLCDPDNRARLEREGRDVHAELAFDADLDNSLFEGLENVTRALHICRGNGPGGRWHSAGGYGAISAELFPRLDFDRLLLEYDTDRAGTFGPLADVRPGTVVVLGLLTTKSGELEDEETVVARIAEAAAIKPVPELALSTQCGFASGATGNPLTPAQQLDKLRLVAAIAHRTWGIDQ